MPAFHPASDLLQIAASRREALPWLRCPAAAFQHAAFFNLVLPKMKFRQGPYSALLPLTSL